MRAAHWEIQWVRRGVIVERLRPNLDRAMREEVREFIALCTADHRRLFPTTVVRVCRRPGSNA